MNQTLDNLRLKMRAQRSALLPKTANESAALVLSHLLSFEKFLKSQHVACYWAVQQEMSCLPIIEHLQKQQKHCYLPVIHPKQPGKMTFALYETSTPLAPNRFGILEPQTPSVSIDTLDFILTPLLAFDKNGHRLGTGGGYYDRAFAHRAPQKPFLCGIGYAFQEVPALKPASWDIRMDDIVTENGLLHL